jgi:hypothetical protein
MRRIVLTFGLIAGAIMSAFMVVTGVFHDRIGFDTGAVIGYTSMVAGFLMVFFGIRAYREQVGGGSITFGRGFVVGLWITLIATACYVATWEFVASKFTPDLMDKYTAYVLEQAKTDGASEEELAKQRAMMEKYKEMYKNPFIRVAMVSGEPLPVALVMTLVAAGILRKARKEHESPPASAA